MHDKTKTESPTSPVSASQWRICVLPLCWATASKCQRNSKMTRKPACLTSTTSLPGVSFPSCNQSSFSSRKASSLILYLPKQRKSIFPFASSWFAASPTNQDATVLDMVSPCSEVCPKDSPAHRYTTDLPLTQRLLAEREAMWHLPFPRNIHRQIYHILRTFVRPIIASHAP